MTSKKKSPPLVAEKRDAPAPKKNKIEVSKPNFQKKTGFHVLLKQLRSHGHLNATKIQTVLVSIPSFSKTIPP